MVRILAWFGLAWLLGMLVSCASVPAGLPTGAPETPPPAPRLPPASPPYRDDAALPPDIVQGKSRWRAVRWAELPGWGQDALHEAWNAWLQSCARPGPALAPLCGDVRRLSIAGAGEQLAWMQQRLQPYRVQALDGNPEGLLTAYFEPVLDASRQPSARHRVPLHRVPPALLQARRSGQPWFTRQELHTLPQAQAQLRGHEIAWLADPVDAMILHIQGSGRLRITEADGSQKLVRLAFAATNEQPYKSVGRWLLDQGAVQDASWPGIKAWLEKNPARTSELLWSNPRVVFFREEALAGADAQLGPRGAQEVPLTAGRSIAVDPQSIPYGTPVWLASPGPTVALQKLVLAQDTGSAIVGAVRADYYAGSGAQAGDLAGRLKQPLQLWVLWPK
ncbi:MAG: murein transglycosylase A [Burkholderiaceae bacterium]